MNQKNFLRFILATLLLVDLAVSAFADVVKLTSADAGFYYQKACNFGGAWDLGYDGSTVTIGIIDDSMQTTHPYYTDRVQTSRFWYATKSPAVGDTVVRTVVFSDGTYSLVEKNTSNPLAADQCHGTCVAGCAASYGTENISIYSLTTDGYYGKAYGAAYQAKLVGMGTDLTNLALPYAYENASVLGAQVVNNSYGTPGGFGTSYGLGLDEAYDSINEIKALHEAVTEKNTIMVFSAGNGRTGVVQGYSYANAKDANKKAAQACPDSIVITATGSGTYGEDYFDTYASFSCYGSNVFAAAPGGNYIVTSDRTDGGYTSTNYNSSFNGTSASSPVAAGVIALGVEALQENPNVATVTPRLIKHLLVQTCQKIDAGASADEAKWVTNAAGNSFSATYGFGQVDAEALVKAAEKTLDVTPQTIVSADWDLTAVDSVHSTTSTLINASTDPTMVYVRGSWINEGTTGLSITDMDISLLETELTKVETTGISTGTSTLDNASITLGIATPNETSVYDGILTMGNGTSEQIFTAWFDNTTLAGVDIQPLEEMTVTLLATSNYFGDLQLEVISPKGTTSILCFADQEQNKGDEDNPDLEWTFSSNAFWGEDPEGEWKVKIKDTTAHNDGTVTDNGITVHGVNTTFYMGQVKKEIPAPETPVPEPGTWVLLVLGSVGIVWLKSRKKR